MSEPTVTCEVCGKTYVDDSDWSGPAHPERDCIRYLLSVQVRWRNVDPREELAGRKWARIVILRPAPNGRGWEAGMGHVEMKHGWHVSTSFAERPMVSDNAWDPAWLWAMAPPGGP